MNPASGLFFPRADRQTPRPSLNDFVDQFQITLKQKDDLSCRLSEALKELALRSQLYEQACAEFDCERSRLNSQIASLRAELSEISRPLEKVSAESGGIQSVLATREKLLRDEFEKKFQELTIEVRQMRKKYTQQVEEMKNQLAGCICQGGGLH